jgi:hypothetical protein
MNSILESEVMAWIADNQDKADSVANSLPRHLQVELADMLIHLARACCVDPADWQRLVSRYVVMH